VNTRLRALGSAALVGVLVGGLPRRSGGAGATTTTRPPTRGVIAVPSPRPSDWLAEPPAGDPDWLTFDGLRFGVAVREQLRRCATEERWTGCWMGQAVYFTDRIPGLDGYAEYVEDAGVLAHLKVHVASAGEAQARAALEARLGSPDRTDEAHWLWSRHGLRIEMFGASGEQVPRVEVCPQAWYDRVRDAVGASGKPAPGRRRARPRGGSRPM
jgi:hypothetical protein